jgi:uncharacterized protein
MQSAAPNPCFSGIHGSSTVFHLRIARRALLQLLLAFAGLFGAVQLFRLLLLPGILAVFHPGDAVTSGLRRIGVLLFAVLAYWAYVRSVEKRKVNELRLAPIGIVLGGLSGALTILLVMLVLFAAGAYVATSYRGLQFGLWGAASVIVVAATLEEIAYRGILFRILENAWGTSAALWLQSLIFALMHIANIEDRASTQEIVITVLSGTLIGAFWTLIFVNTRNLWVVAANHAAWNFTIILAGLPLSGLGDWLPLAPFASEVHGPGWLTGGVFGPEDSVLTIVVVTIGLIGMFRFAKARDRLVRPGASRIAGTAPEPVTQHA